MGALRGHTGLSWRAGLANIARRPQESVWQISALGLGVMALLLLTVLRTDLLGLPKLTLNINIPGLLVEQIIPVTTMIGLPILLSAVAHKMKWAQTKRDHMILQFSGFIAVYVLLTIVGTFFRGQGLALTPYTIFSHE